MIKVFLAGEGVHELGGWAGEPAHRDAGRRGDAADLDRLPLDAASLRSWLDDARRLLASDKGT